ncbi:hypothetical protein JKA74_20430 [Marivirga sp. S37H4]|uniref:Tryptophan-rich sensory protein n=1 Tax=Marivirga aurantiaca TaxID=2802615 RepID=A0A934X306_9BACT|nr:DUF4175 family protein [Marivirga aurantiaca]MBK6267420.1 hypothetical protein [Marivirga aurantiaca]
MHKDFLTYWQKVLAKFYASQLGAIFLVTGATLMLTLGILAFLNIPWPVEFIFTYVILLLFLFLIWSPLLRLSQGFIIDYLHQRYPQLEYSLGLFFQSKLNEVEQIQKEKILKQLPVVSKIPVTENWRILILFAACSLMVFLLGMSNFNPRFKDHTQISIEADTLQTFAQTIDKEAFERGSIQIKVNPPAYTGLRGFNWKEGKVIPEGSLLDFEVMDGNMTPYLIFQGIDTVDFTKYEGNWGHQYKLNFSQAFQVYYKAGDLIHTDEIKILEVLPDQKPMIQFDLKENRVEIPWTSIDIPFPMKIHIKDDYGVSTAKVVATLSKGDGEAVKFREMKWSLPGFRQGRKDQTINYNLQIDTLDLEPGDELYFFIEVADNKYRENQKTKSEVFFIEIADTVQQESVAFDGLALSIEPEFFKSQRQIIIDTEKLLKERKTLSRFQFEDRSDEIGADQKILRLRYGIFLGEEYEVTGGLGERAFGDHEHEEEGEHDHEEHDENDPHQDHSGHDHVNGTQPGERNFSNDLYNSPELEVYVHSHDNSEIATFFDADVKKKLKEALANMWEAELYLRTYKPKKALPFEYKALELIKEVQRASRIYVQRMGFEPPPLESDKKRLTGELEDIKPKTIDYSENREDFVHLLRDKVKQMKQIELSNDLNQQKQLAQELSELVVRETLQNPVRYALILARINEFNQSESQIDFKEIILLTEEILPSIPNKLSADKTPDLKLKSIFHQQIENN